MVNSQEIIGRSIYSALLGVAVKLGYSVNPEDFLPINAENSKKFKEAISKLKNLFKYLVQVIINQKIKKKHQE